MDEERKNAERLDKTARKACSNYDMGNNAELPAPHKLVNPFIKTALLGYCSENPVKIRVSVKFNVLDIRGEAFSVPAQMTDRTYLLDIVVILVNRLADIINYVLFLSSRFYLYTYFT